jgi:hypothetical protein
MFAAASIRDISATVAGEGVGDGFALGANIEASDKGRVCEARRLANGVTLRHGCEIRKSVRCEAAGGGRVEKERRGGGRRCKALSSWKTVSMDES